MSISHSFKPKIDAAALKVLDSKLRLVERTNNLLEEEIEFIRVDPEYAQACVGWLPAKVYYNIYHLLAIIEYILTGQKLHLRISHESCLKGFAKRIDGGILKFNCPTLNIVCDKAILKFRSVSGEILSKGITDERLISLVMKKIATDKLDDFKLRKGLDLRKKADKSKYQKAKEELNISIIDFFYSMRIRTNYRDMSFLDELDAERTRRYFLKNHEASTNFFQLPQRVQKRLSCQHPLGEKEARYNATFLAASSASPAAASSIPSPASPQCLLASLPFQMAVAD